MFTQGGKWNIYEVKTEQGLKQTAWMRYVLRKDIDTTNKSTSEPIAFIKYQEDAQLIASAPDMYEALKDIDMLYAEYTGLKPEPLTESWNLVQSIVQKYHKALAKAEGK